MVAEIEIWAQKWSEIAGRRKHFFSKHRPFGPMLSISQFVHMCVCVCVCSLLRYHLTVYLPPLPEVGCPIFLEIPNSWGKVMERSGLTFEHFCLEVVYDCKTNFFSFFC